MDKVEQALEWYAEQVAGCRKISSNGDVARQALDADGGKRARDAITVHQAERLAAQPSIPDGRKLVPVEPTEKMASAEADELFESVGQDWNEDARRIWSAMLTAAPTPPDVAS